MWLLLPVTMLGAVDAVDATSRVSVDAADLLMVSSLASTRRVEHGSFAAGPPPSPVHGASQAMLIDGRLGWAPDRGVRPERRRAY